VRHQKKLKDQTQEDIEIEQKQTEQNIFVDSMLLDQETDLKKTLFADSQELKYADGQLVEQSIVFSCFVHKTNRWQQK